MRLLLLVLTLASQNPAEVLVQGTVRDATGLPLPGAAIEIDGRLAAVSDSDGDFHVVLSPTAPVSMAASLAGFRRWQSIIVADSPAARIDVVLQVAGLDDRVTVSAAPAEQDVSPVFALQPVQIYRTPGAQADTLRALQALPGVSSPDEGAGLFVRGGDVSEVLVTLDDAVVAHPYRAETPTGGFRGAIDPMQIAALSFTTGGFGARHGNVLSGVVDLRGLEQPRLAETTATVGLAAAAAAIAAPFGTRAGGRAAFNRTFTALLFAVNGSPRRFDPPPGGWDGSASLALSLGSAGRIRTIGLVQRDDVGVEIERDAFVGLLRSGSRHRFVAVRWDGSLSRWAASLTFGSDAYEQSTATGILHVATEDAVRSWRAEAAHISSGWRVGANGAFGATDAHGTVPLRGGDLEGISGSTPFDVRVRDWFGGIYADVTTTRGRVSLTPGLRVDRFGHAVATTVDPRLGARLDLGGGGALRLATGMYHQAPSQSYLDRHRGAVRLPPMRAVHYIVGYEAGQQEEGGYVRVEGYRKTYSRLPLEDARLGYTAEGYGSARGVDVFAQWLTAGLELRVSASWVHARRRWTPADQRQRYALPEGTWAPDFDVPWSTQLIANIPVARDKDVGVSWRSAAGRPHTPIVGARETGDGLAPEFGPINSERFPRYERLDVSFNWLVPTGRGITMFFVSLDNALGRANGRDYVYSPDYSSRRIVTSAAPRMFYAGFSFRR